MVDRFGSSRRRHEVVDDETAVADADLTLHPAVVVDFREVDLAVLDFRDLRVGRPPDVAITQLVVEIIAVIILIRATVRKGLPRSPSSAGVLAGAVAVIFIVVLLLVASSAFTELPEFGAPTMRVAGDYVRNAMMDTGAANVVGAVLLDFRAYDTLGEATVLFTAVIGVVAVTRRIGRKESDESGKDNE